MYEDQRRRSVSPGGTGYREVSNLKERRKKAKAEGHKSKDREFQQIVSGKYSSRRDASGSNNPSHDSATGLSLLRNGAVSPNPYSPGSREEKEHLMNPNRHFRTQSPGGTETGIVEGHGNTVMGHHGGASAGQNWNRKGHQQIRKQNLEDNRNPEAYHGLEKRLLSAKSGHKEARYQDPTPSKGSHPSHFLVTDPNFKGGFGPYYEKEIK